ncbi:hypothetical protein JTY60_00790 [symbiont of Argiope bruennichi]|uniref:hypothetical protein n=1 Tax=symbiont of Argiope bruennichi TaxID=2810479 RepID=UPI003DA39458
MKNPRIKLFKIKKNFTFLAFFLLILSGCGTDLNYQINTNIISSIDNNKSLSCLTDISKLFLNYPTYFSKGKVVKDLDQLADMLEDSLNPDPDPRPVPSGVIRNLLSFNSEDKEDPYRFCFDHYDSIYFYVDGGGSFVNCDPAVDGVKYCVGYGGAIKIKKDIQYYWFYFNDSLNKNEDAIDKITEITKIILV